MAETPEGKPPAGQVPLVDYLVLGDDPYLVASECEDCLARYFGRRNACASCSGTSFRTVAIPREGTVRTFTIVSLAAPGVPVPFVAAVVDCGGTVVRGNLVKVEPDPEHVTLGMIRCAPTAGRRRREPSSRAWRNLRPSHCSPGRPCHGQYWESGGHQPAAVWRPARL